MFKKKSCGKCGNKISSKYEFCPYCGNSLGQNPEGDFGMLGKNDGSNEFEQFSSSLFGKVGGSVITKMLGGAMKMLEKEMQKEIKNQDLRPRTKVKLMINGKEIDLDNQKKHVSTQIKKLPQNNFSKADLKKFSNLPREEPQTNIRRFSDKVVYEISMPKVNSIKEISIVKLENSIEIKALAKNKVYSKLIPIGLPILNYEFSKGKLVLEFGVVN